MIKKMQQHAKNDPQVAIIKGFHAFICITKVVYNLNCLTIQYIKPMFYLCFKYLNITIYVSVPAGKWIVLLYELLSSCGQD